MNWKPSLHNALFVPLFRGRFESNNSFFLFRFVSIFLLPSKKNGGNEASLGKFREGKYYPRGFGGLAGGRRAGKIRVFELFLNGREGGPARLSTRSVERAVYISESIDREETAPQETGRQEEEEEEGGLFNDRAVSARR